MVKHEIKNQLMLSFVILFLGFIVGLTNVSAQPKLRAENNCESNLPYISNAATRVSAGSTIIVIARLGKNEKSAKYSQRRLQVVKRILFRGDVPENQIILAFGEKTNGKGRIELYVNGVLDVIFEVPFKENLKAENCDLN